MTDEEFQNFKRSTDLMLAVNPDGDATVAISLKDMVELVGYQATMQARCEALASRSPVSVADHEALKLELAACKELAGRWKALANEADIQRDQAQALHRQAEAKISAAWTILHTPAAR